VHWQEAPGYEADDLIASYARVATEDFEVMIFTGDKDLTQCLVRPNMFLRRSISNSRRGEVDAAAVKEQWGVQPELMGDLLALAGDI
jgi:DNA polymerase-1